MPSFTEIVKFLRSWLGLSARSASKKSSARSKAPTKKKTLKKSAPRKKTSNVRKIAKLSPNTKKKTLKKPSTVKKKPISRKTKAAATLKRAPAKNKKSAPKSPVKKRVSSRSAAPEIQSPLIGEITHYFSKIKVAVIKITKTPIKVGDQVNIKGKTTDLIQKISSMQIESVDVKTAEKGQLIGVKVKKAVRVSDKVYKIA